MRCVLRCFFFVFLNHTAHAPTSHTARATLHSLPPFLSSPCSPDQLGDEPLGSNPILLRHGVLSDVRLRVHGNDALAAIQALQVGFDMDAAHYDSPVMTRAARGTFYGVSLSLCLCILSCAHVVQSKSAELLLTL